MIAELAETVPAQEIKRRGIGMLHDRVKRGPVWVISGNRPRYVVLDADEYRRERHEVFVTEVLQSEKDCKNGQGIKTAASELMESLDKETRYSKRRQRRFETPVFHGGRPLLANIASTAELLSTAEGEDYK